MHVKSLSLVVPDDKPYDNPENWFLSFVGNNLLPVIEEGNISRFWFTAYGAVGHEQGKHIRFRFEVHDLALVKARISHLIECFGNDPSGYTDYNVGKDIGRGEKSRFLGTNAKHQDEVRRGDLAFNFLHASACLMLDCLVGPDTDGYFALESVTESGFSIETPLEQFHHLFCNMTQVPTFLGLGAPPNQQQVIPSTIMEMKQRQRVAGWQIGNLRKGMF